MKLQRWFDVTTVILAIRLLGYIPLLFIEGGSVIFFGIIWCAYSAYSLWVVNIFRKQLLTTGESSLLRDTVYYSRDEKIWTLVWRKSNNLVVQEYLSFYASNFVAIPNLEGQTVWQNLRHNSTLFHELALWKKENFLCEKSPYVILMHMSRFKMFEI